jgi:UDP-glucose:(glucosyl)LPS beta-1,3-glucosyltransferase
MQDILISIIIPVYNSGAFIKNTLDMLLKQNIDDCEVIIVDDGSSDESKEICREYCVSHAGFELIAMSHAGVSVARNTGMDHAGGEYIYFLDSDDSLPEESLSFFRQKIRENAKPDILAFGYCTSQNRKIVRQYAFPCYSDRVFTESDSFLELFLAKKVYCHLGSMLLLNGFAVKNKLKFSPGITVGEDTEFIINSLHAASKIYYHERLSFIYQLRADSVMRGYKEFRIEQCYVIPLLLRCSGSFHNIGVMRTMYLYAANFYILNLFYYLRSNVKDKAINAFFLENRHLLLKSVSGNFIRAMLICFFRFVPVKPLLKLFRKV